TLPRTAAAPQIPPPQRKPVRTPAAVASSRSPTMSAAAGQESVHHSGQLKFLSALFYAGSSFLITVVNKTVLTSFRYMRSRSLWSFQMITTVVVLYTAKMSKTVQFQDFDRSILLKIFPLPLLYVGNHITGLASTKKLSLPMFTVLRKFTILMTMILEVYVLRKTFPKRIVYSVAAIILGAIVAASSDLAFDAEGYTFILLNDAFTAAGGVFTKKKIGTEGLGKYGVLFYNALIIVIPTLLASAFTGDLHEVHTVTVVQVYSLWVFVLFLPESLVCSDPQAATFEDWIKATFIFCFLMSCFMGLISPNKIVTNLHKYENLKNIAVAYTGIFVGGDYMFSWTNFLGLSICMSGGLMYSYLTFNNKSSRGNAEEAQELKIHKTEKSKENFSAH
ncbi:hypothetical protein L3Q82_023206, partial [Scortum barcoo]